MADRIKDNVSTLNQLKAGHSYLIGDGPSAEILECFENKYPKATYVDTYTFPEFTSLCPVTGQPDFATIVLEYVPDKLCIESKSFKIYMFAYRTHQSFMETITNAILEDVVAKADPKWVRVKGLFAPRGGTAIHVFAEHWKENLPDAEAVRQFVHEWKVEPAPHSAV